MKISRSCTYLSTYAKGCNLMPLTSLWVNVSDLESDLPYHEAVRMEWAVKKLARFLTFPINAATEKG